jgi:hypothetical protein
MKEFRSTVLTFILLVHIAFYCEVFITWKMRNTIKRIISFLAILFTLIGLWGFQPSIFNESKTEVQDTLDDDLLLLSSLPFEDLPNQLDE